MNWSEDQNTSADCNHDWNPVNGGREVCPRCGGLRSPSKLSDGTGIDYEALADAEPSAYARYCGAVQPVLDSTEEGFTCSRPLGHSDERHGYAGVFWTGDARAEETTDGIDYEALATGLDQYRECLRAMVAGLMADGFTDAQARALVTRLMSPPE